MFKLFGKKNIIKCEYCNSPNYINDDLRCKSCGAPLSYESISILPTDENKPVTNRCDDGLVRGGQGNFRLVTIDSEKKVESRTDLLMLYDNEIVLSKSPIKESLTLELIKPHERLCESKRISIDKYEFANSYTIVFSDSFYKKYKEYKIFARYDYFEYKSPR